MTKFERLKQVDKHISLLKSILKKGEYKVAGIKLEINIGNVDYLDVSLGMYSLLEEEILTTILRGLENTSDTLKKEVLKEVKQIRDYLGTDL